MVKNLFQHAIYPMCELSQCFENILLNAHRQAALIISFSHIQPDQKDSLFRTHHSWTLNLARGISNPHRNPLKN